MAANNEKTHPNQGAFPKIGGPALRALHHAGVTSMAGLARWSEADLLALHGVGPKAVRILSETLAESGKSFRK